VREREALADRDRLGVKADRFAVAAVAPRHRTQVVERVGGMALVAHRAAFGEGLREALSRALVVVGAAVGHAELDHGVARLLALAAPLGRLDHPPDVGHGAFGLPRLGARAAARSSQCSASRMAKSARERSAASSRYWSAFSHAWPRSQCSASRAWRSS